ncbi:hypothetical protein [Alienimonas chondri]|uniref:UDP-N-acetylmuramoyl-L-alanine--D-glutamate ligase n=1 Tax=Alienimonas chondri TaxID=2681879 RepID=A0ABX1VIR0_9PLAN|nr:hypothetical protein [Alienimonas chondri]NNJ27970.1 hypothetical protein [Alienimonas chondri]NNJ27971.1 hypothetical protein [Alienimonas chondri]
MNAPAIASGSSVTVMGLGTHGGGAGAVRYLCREGANVTLTDRRTAEELAEPLSKNSRTKYDGRSHLGS